MGDVPNRLPKIRFLDRAGAVRLELQALGYATRSWFSDVIVLRAHRGESFEPWVSPFGARRRLLRDLALQLAAAQHGGTIDFELSIAKHAVYLRLASAGPQTLAVTFYRARPYHFEFDALPVADAKSFSEIAFTRCHACGTRVCTPIDPAGKVETVLEYDTTHTCAACGMVCVVPAHGPNVHIYHRSLLNEG